MEYEYPNSVLTTQLPLRQKGERERERVVAFTRGEGFPRVKGIPQLWGFLVSKLSSTLRFSSQREPTALRFLESKIFSSQKHSSTLRFPQIQSFLEQGFIESMLSSSERQPSTLWFFKSKLFLHQRHSSLERFCKVKSSSSENSLSGCFFSHKFPWARFVDLIPRVGIRNSTNLQKKGDLTRDFDFSCTSHPP